MSQQQVEVLRRGYEAFNRGELLVEFVDPDFEGDLPEVGLGLPPVRGPEGLRGWFVAVREIWDDFRLDPQEFIDVDAEHVVVAVRLRARGKLSAVPIDEPFFNVWTFRGNRALRVELQPTRAAALAAAGK